MKYNAKQPRMLNTSQGVGLIGGKADRGDPKPQEKGAVKAKSRAREAKADNVFHSIKG